jgi:hypothetical protein
VLNKFLMVVAGCACPVVSGFVVTRIANSADAAVTADAVYILAAVATAVKNGPSGELIMSNADWHDAQLTDKRLPRATEIDAVSRNHPVVLVRGGHDYNHAVVFRTPLKRPAIDLSGRRAWCDPAPRHHANSRSSCQASPTPRREIVLYKETARDLMW